MFSDPNMIQKLASNPKTAPLLADQEFMAKLQRLRTNPNDIGMELQDPRFLQVMSVLMGIDMSFGAPPGAGEQSSSGVKEEEDVEMPDARPAPKYEPKKEPEPEPEPEEDEETKAAKEAKAQADELKKKGTEFYKKRQFDQAIEHYTKAWELHKDIAYKTNLGAAKFEKGDYEGAIQACNEAIEYGREVHADFKIVAKYVRSTHCQPSTNVRQGLRSHRYFIRKARRPPQRDPQLPKGADRAPHTRGPRQAASSGKDQDHKGQGVLHQPRRG